MTSPQAAIWLDQDRGNDPARYNICNVIRFEGNLDIAVLHQAIIRTEQENDVLRLRFASNGGEISQSFAQVCLPTDFSVVDLRFADDIEASANEEVTFARTRLIGPTADTNCRHRLLRLGDDYYWWVRVYHHLVCDGFSGNVMADRVAEIYRAVQSGVAVPQTAFESYLGFISSEMAYPASPSYQRDIAYWTERLALDKPATRFSSRADRYSPRQLQLVERMSREKLAVLEDVAKQCRTSSTAVMMAAFMILLAEVSADRHPVMTVPLLNRLGRKERNMPGTFSCVVPFDVNLDEHASFAELAQSIFARVRRDVRHIRLSPVRMRAANLGGKSLSGSGAYFNSLGLLPPLDFGDVTARHKNVYNGPVTDIGLVYLIETVGGDDQEAELVWQYNAARIDHETVGLISKRFHELLDAILADTGKEPLAFMTKIGRDAYRGLCDDVTEAAREDVGVGDALSTEDPELVTEIGRIWQGLIQIDEITPDDNLFEIGAHSLLVPRAQYALSKLAGRQIASVEIFEYPTVRAFARHIGAGQRANGPVVNGDEHVAAQPHQTRSSQKARAVSSVASAMPFVLKLSAKTPAALDDEIARLRNRVADIADAGNLINLHDLTAHLSHKRPCSVRTAIIATDREAVISALADEKSPARISGRVPDVPPSVILLFPGQGSQRPGMARTLYDADTTSAELIDRACAMVSRLSGPDDLRDLLLAVGQNADDSERLARTGRTQPALFIFEYALADYLVRRGVSPAALAGHSIGEYVAACLAGVMSFDDALRLVVLRGRLMASTEPGAMYGVSMVAADMADLQAVFGPELSIASVNGPRQYVVAGSIDCIDRLEIYLRAKGKPGQRLAVSQAFHSSMMDPILDEFRQIVALVELSAPKIPIQSNLTGQWLSDADAMDPDYWVSHLRNTVRFADNIKGLAAALPGAFMVDCGFGNTASRLAAVNGVNTKQCIALQPASKPETGIGPDDVGLLALTRALAKMWVLGVAVDFDVIKHVSENGHYPVVASFGAHPAIEGQWLARRDLPPDDSYHIITSLRLPDGTEFSQLQSVLERIIARHETLRSTFVENEGELVQRVHAHMSIPCVRLDQFEDIRTGLFDLEKGPLARFGYLDQTQARPPLLAIAIDHLCFDGQSLALLQADISAELLGGVPVPSCPAQILAERARQGLTGARGQNARAFWRTRAETLLAERLPADPLTGQGTDDGGSGKRLFIRLSPQQTVALETLSRHVSRSTRTALWSALVIAVLARHKESGSAVLGLPFAGRVDQDSRQALGCFANVLPIAIAPDMTRGLADLVQQVGREILLMMDVQDYPLSRLSMDLSAMAHGPVGLPFDAVSVIEINEDIDDIDDIDFGAGKFPLMVALVKCGSGTYLAIEYQTSIYGTRWAERFADHFLTFVCSCAVNPLHPLGGVGLLPAHDKQLLLTAWNDTGSDYPRNCGLGELLARRIGDPACAGRIAIDDGKNTITYRDMGPRLAAISSALDDIGVLPGDIVGLAAARGFESILTFLGIAWHGAAYLPIDKALPPRAVGDLMSECGARTLLCDAGEYQRLSDLQQKFQLAGLPDGVGQNGFLGKPFGERTGNDLAYVMFTSGSTGTPKGVLVPNRAVARLVLNNKSLSFDENDVIAQAAPLGFDASTLEIWAAVLNGGRLCVIDDDALFDPDTLRDALGRGAVSTMWLTASLFNRIADEAPATFAALKRLLSGGEALSPAHVAMVRAACPDLILINGYGPTENTTFTCTHVITHEDILTGNIPVGTPVGNSRVYILDARGEVAPINVWGELYAAGDGLALGYSGAPERTSKAFVQLKCLGDERLYKTGDRARWRADGVIEFGGRNDGQVKIRGHRIELGAVERKLSILDGIRTACVMPIGSGADAILGAAIAADNDVRDVWTGALARDLPGYMVPERIVVLKHLPVTVNGKVDRNKLHKILLTQDAPVAMQSTVNGDDAQLVIDQFGVLFAGQEITPASDFFALGGHSLTAMRLAGMIEKQTGFRPRLQDIFSARTVASLAQLIARNQQVAVKNTLPRARGDSFPLSSGQARLWVLQRLQPDLAVYSVPATLEIAGAIDVAALQRALYALQERQHVLRLRFRTDMGHPDGVSQYLAPGGDWTLRHHHMDEETARRFIEQEIARPFILDNAPMARADLLTLDPDRHWLMISLHHAICDGWSMPILLRELSAFYGAETGGAAPCLPNIERHYEDFASWQHDFLKNNAGKAAIGRWKERLLPLCEPLALPTDHPRPAERRFCGDFLDFDIDADNQGLIDAAATRYGTTAFNILTALVQVLLYRHCGQTDIPLGMLVAGREHATLDDTIGFFVNTVPLRQNIDPEARFAQHLAQTGKTISDALFDQAVPFEGIVNAVNAPRDLSRNPLFDVLVAWQDAMPEMGHLGDARLSLVETRFPYAKFDLGFYFWRANGAVRGQVEFDTDLFDPATINGFVTRLNILCRAALSAGETTPIAHLAMMPAGERALIDQFNATACDMPVERCISAPFLDQVTDTPDAIAVMDEDGALTYAQFARRAAGIAARLRAASVGPGDVVGIAVRRSINMLAAVHGTLLAGAAYSPLDPDHPAQRRRDMLEDLGAASVVVTTADCAGLFDGTRTILIDGDEDGDIPALASRADDLAYVLFTSGSTGRPKGVEIVHRGVLNRILWMQDAFPIGPGDVILQKTPITFDVSVWELFWWSWTGAKVVLPAPGAEKDPQKIATEIDRHQVTTIHFVPSMLSTFLFAIESGMVDIAKLSSLRRVFASGEALDGATVRRFNDILYQSFGTELHNLYGPTEATVDVTWQSCSPHKTGSIVPIGKPIANTTVQILGREMDVLPIGVIGEIVLGGSQIALGYRNRPDLSAEKFPQDPQNPGGRLYRTGDLGRWRRDGSVEYLGRIDHQVKIRGFRIECGEVETALESHPAIERAPVKAVKVGELDELHAFVLGSDDLTVADVREHLRHRLPEYMIPARFFAIDHLPQTSSGKVDRNALSGRLMRTVKSGDGLSVTPQETAAKTDMQVSALEEKLRRVWQDILPGVEPTRDDGFFEIGGNSLLLLRLFEKINGIWPGKIGIADLFANPSIARQAEYLSGQDAHFVTGPQSMIAGNRFTSNEPIAVIGIGIRVADAEDLERFWQNIASGRDHVRALPISRDEETRDLLAVMGRAVPIKFREAAYLDNIFDFDAARFRMAPVDAGLLDPEQRLFIETTLSAMEDAGYGGNALRGQKVGVFAGGGANPVWRVAMDHVAQSKAEQVFALNVPSNIVTRLSFLKDWRGPAQVVDTACSSSLVAVHQACQNLRDGTCTIAIAGGAKVLPSPPDAASGFSIDSSTARTRAFDANADGTGMGEGSVIFVLKPLSAALQDGDNIHAVIRGSAVNQDGSSSGAAAPNPVMQAEVVRQAAQAGDIDLASISYFEAHGTGTALGDPIEIDGLSRAFADVAPNADLAFIGSGKGNYGHLDGAAGALGLARAIMALRHDQVPPQPFYERPNPKIDFARAPVRVAARLEKLPDRGVPRLAGISSFGLSGINAHIVIEAAPVRSPITRIGDDDEGYFVVALSASNPDALRDYGKNLLRRLQNDPDLKVRDIAFTLATGRDSLKYRFAVAVRDSDALQNYLQQLAAGTGDFSATANADQNRKVNAVACDKAAAQVQIAAYLDGAVLVWPEKSKARRVSLPPSPYVRKTCKPVFEVKTSGAVSLLQGPIETAGGRSFAIAINDPAFWPTNEHRLNGQPTLVGMAVPALMAQAIRQLGDGAQPATVSDLVWHQALVASALPNGNVTLTFANDGQVELGGRLKNGQWRVFASAHWNQNAVPVFDSPMSLDTVRAKANIFVPIATFNENFGSISTSPRWDCVVSLHCDEQKTTAIKHLRLRSDYHADLQNWLYHPALADAACSMALNDDDRGSVPVGIDQVIVYGVPSAEVFACGEMQSSGRLNVTLFDVKSGDPVLAVNGIRFAKAGQNSQNGHPELLKTYWKPANLKPQAVVAGCLFITDGDFWPVSGDHRSVHPQTLDKATFVGISNVVVALQPGPDAAFRTAGVLRNVLRNMAGKLRLVVVGCGAFEVGNDVAIDPDQSAAAGVVIGVAHEDPKLVLSYADITPDAVLEHIGSELAFMPLRDPVALYRDGQRFVRDLRGLAAADTAKKSIWPDDGVCVVTGGAGGFGLALAEEMALNGKVRLAFVGRRAEDDLDADTQKQVAVLRGKGIDISLFSCDVSDRKSLDETLAHIRTALGPITAVAHAAGIADGGFLALRDMDKFDGILSAKIDGARNLDQLTINDPVQAFVMFGSLTAITGAAGQSAYCAANAFLDGFAFYRRSKGLPAMVIDWCTLSDQGMAARNNVVLHAGAWMTPAQAVSMWRDALCCNLAQVTILDPTILESQNTHALVANTNSAASIVPVISPQNGTSRIAAIWAETLGYDNVDTGEDFFALGGDSITGMQIVDRMNAELSLSLTISDLFSASTVSAIAELAGVNTPEPAVMASPVNAELQKADPLSAISKIWAETLGYDAVDPAEDFYALGGDSITGMQIVDRINGELGSSINLVDLFEHSTVVALGRKLFDLWPEPRRTDDGELVINGFSDAPAAYLASPNHDSAGHSAPHRHDVAKYPVAPEQLSVLNAGQKGNMGTAFNLPHAFLLDDSINLAQLCDAIGQLVARHEILRTRISQQDDVWQMEVLDPVDARPDLTPVLIEDQLEDACAGLVTPFDLDREIPVRWKILADPSGRNALFFDIHHVLADGFTTELLFADLFDLYRGTTLPPLTRQLHDYAVWSQSAENQARLEDAKNYWHSLYRGALPKFDLPSDRRRPAFHTFTGDITSFEVDDSLLADARKFAAGQRVTMFTLILSTWFTVLSRLAETDDMVISVPVDSRDASGFRGVPGMMVSLLPLRMQINDGDTVKAFVEKMQRHHVDAMRHRAYFLDRLLDDLCPPAAPDRTLLSEVTLSYMNYQAAPNDANTHIPPIGLMRHHCKNDLAIFVRDVPGRMTISFDYYVDLFDRARMEDLGRIFVTTLRQLITNDSQHLDAISLLPGDQAAQLVDWENGPDVAIPAQDGLFAQFAKQAALSPDHCAVRDATGTWTYAQLMARAGGIARHLENSGIGQGDLVALHLERGRDAVAAMLGIVALGAGYVPLDSAYPAERNHFILGDSAARLVLVDDAGKASLGDLSSQGVDMCHVGNIPDAGSDFVVPVLETPQGAPAYLMYTSGSTGTPKGVLIEQGAVLRLALGADYAGLFAGAVMAQAGPLAFDAATLEIWAPLLQGAEIAVIGRDTVLDPVQFGAALDGFGVTTMYLSVGLFNRQVDVDAESLARLSVLMIGGESISKSHVRKFMEKCPDTRLFNGYGPTESTTFAAITAILASDVCNDSDFTIIGRPIAHTRTLIRDANGLRVPVGAWGELMIGGDRLAREYWQRPDLTAEKFIADPDRPAGRLYRTGDIARWTRDGRIEFGGRRDNQIKLRGFRIELDEIEHQLQQAPFLQNAVVLFNQDGVNGGEIIACIQASAAQEPVSSDTRIAELQAWLGKRLPGYMIPAKWYWVDDIPVTANGKVDRAELLDQVRRQSPAGTQAGIVDTVLLPEEQVIADIFSDVFQVPIQDRNTGFAALGGHSLMAIRIVNRIADRTGNRISMADFFASPTIAALARHIHDMGAPDGNLRAGGILPAPEMAHYPASHAQKRLYLLSRMDRTGSAYGMVFVLRCNGALRVDILQEALRLLIERHETLRTCFQEYDGVITQQISPVSAPDVVVNDVSDHVDPAREALRLTRQEAATPVELDKPPLIRGRVIMVGTDECLVVLTTHHIVGDGWSSKILVQELGILYQAVLAKTASALAPLPITYKDYAWWQAGQDWSDAAAYWQEKLKGAPGQIALPTDRAAPDMQSYRGAHRHLEIEAGVLAGLHKLARAHNTTLSAVGLALFSAMLYRLTRQQDMVIGMGVAGRERTETEGLIGFFVNVLPIRVQLDDETNLGTLIDDLHGNITAALDRQDYPFDELVRAVAPKRNANRQPLVNVVFEYQRFGDISNQDEKGGLPLARQGQAGILPDNLDAFVDNMTAKHDVILFLVEEAGQARFTLEYDTDLFDAETMQRWLAFLGKFSRAAVQDI